MIIRRRFTRKLEKSQLSELIGFAAGEMGDLAVDGRDFLGFGAGKRKLRPAVGGDCHGKGVADSSSTFDGWLGTFFFLNRSGLERATTVSRAGSWAGLNPHNPPCFSRVVRINSLLWGM